jgi:hypothetical protein
MQSVKLTTSQKITHYLFSLMMATLGLIFLIIFFIGWLNQFITPFISISAAILFVTIAIVAFVKQKKTLRYYSIKTHNSAKENAGLIKTILRQHGWQAVRITDDIIQAKGHGFRHKLDPRTWAELMTFHVNHNIIKVNSICDPNERAQFIDHGKNKQNVEDFERIFFNTPAV